MVHFQKIGGLTQIVISLTMSSSHNSNNLGLNTSSVPMAMTDASINTNTAGSGPKKSNDPAWAYGIVKPKHPIFVFCKLCGKKLSGGVFRLKQHLTGSKLTKKGGKNNAGKICPNVTSVIKKEILDYQNEFYKKRQEKERIENELIRRKELFNLGSEEEMELEDLVSGDVNSQPQELDEGGDGPRPTGGINIGQKRANTTKGPLDIMLPPKFAKGKLFQSTVDNEYKKKLRDKAAYQFAQWMYDAGISFNAVRYGSFKRIFEYVGHAGPDMKPPTYYEVRVSFLEKKYREVEGFVKNFKVHWETYGCSVMSDGWTDGKHRTLINFLVNCPKGTVFLKSVDASEHVKSAAMLAEMIENVIIEHVGVSNVVQVITDNASNYKAAGDILMTKYTSLYWGACTAHCLDLILEDIGKLPKFSKVVKDSQKLASFIYNRPRVLHLMRSFTKNKELVRPAITRFATNFLCLESIHANKDALRGMFVSTRWHQIDWSRKVEGKRMASIVARTGFWSDIAHCLKVLSPLVEVVRLVSAEEKLAMGYIYHAMGRAKELIKKKLNDDPRLFVEYWKIVDARWDEQLHQDLHAAGYYLNPQLYFERGMLQMEADNQIKQRLFSLIAKMSTDPNEEDEIYRQLVTYREAKGMMGLPAAIRRRSTTAPAEWWITYGSDVKELQRFAIRVLSQTVTATPCERNWSAFENVHTKKRNHLAQKKLNDLVYIQYNENLRCRFENRLNLRGGEMDPIILRDIDDCNEWITLTDDDLVFEGDDLTWRVVEEAMGLDDVGPSTRSRRVQPQRQRMELVDEEDDVADEEDGDDDNTQNDDGPGSGDDEDLVAAE